MGSKAPRVGPSAQDEPREDEQPGRAAPSASSRLLQRIADALQVSPTVLHASDLVPALGGDGTLDGDLDRECVALLRAYTRIADLEERRRLLAIVQAAAAPA